MSLKYIGLKTTDHLVMDQAAQSDLNIIKDSIFKQVDDVRAIYLFGSVARGTENRNSDYDVLIFVQKPPKNKVRTISNIRIDVEDRIKRRLEPILMDVEDVNYASPILYEVYHNNKLIYWENVLRQRLAITLLPARDK